MSLKKLGIALLAVFALGAFVANSAMASNEYTTHKSYWYTGTSPGTKLGSGEANHKALTLEAVGTQFLESNIGGTPIKFSATTVKGSSCFIDNTTAAVAGTPEDVATVDCTLIFEGVKLVEPTTCSTESTITTKALTAEVGMNKANTIDTTEIFPVAGIGTTFATITISGASCPIAGLSKITGTVFSEAVNATGVFAEKQELKTSKAIQESAGTATSLKYGEKAAFLTGALKSSIGGTPFGTKES